VTTAARLAAHLTDWLRSEIAAGGGAGAVFGLSGGVDSAVVGALAKRAFPHHALGVLMPCHSDPADAEDALLVAHHVDLATATVDLGPVYDALVAQLGEASSDLPGHRLATANLKPRLRMTALYAFANLLDYRVLGTGNLDELTIGYFTKFGDGGCDLLPLGSLTKGEVRGLARELGLPERIITKPPSAGLWAGQTDEGEIGLTYADIDEYLRDGQVAPNVRARIEALRDASAHKRTLPKIAPLPEED
jgi:NAD+ synthase